MDIKLVLNVCTLITLFIDNHSMNLTDFEVENKLKNYDIKPRNTIHIDTAIQLFDEVLQQIDYQINDKSELSTYFYQIMYISNSCFSGTLN